MIEEDKNPAADAPEVKAPGRKPKAEAPEVKTEEGKPKVQKIEHEAGVLYVKHN